MKYEPWSSAAGHDFTVAVITGSRPPDICGVGDYTELLCSALSAVGVNTRVLYTPHPRLSDLSATRCKIAETRADLVHIQYPTWGYGRSIVPFLLTHPIIRIPCVVTIHEFSIFRFPRSLAFATFAWGADARIFSNEQELSAFKRYYPLRRGLDIVIPIGSNMPVAAHEMPRSDEVVYFGQLTPYKGLDCFLKLAQLSYDERFNCRFLIVGGVPEKHQAFGRRLSASAETLGIRVELNLSSAEVAKRLARAAFVYLPFPDGASPKRGSMIAALLNGAIVLTRHSANTPDWLRDATVHVENPQDALTKMKQLSSNHQESSRVLSAANLLSARFRWPAIAAAHRSLYQAVLSKAPSRAALRAAWLMH